jgi:peroxiredoxin
MRPDITLGATFPNYRLTDHSGQEQRLSEIQGDDPMIVVLAREAYSAKDQVQQEGLVQLWREMKPGVGYCRLVTITTSNPQETLNYRSGVGAEWPFLADPDRIVQRDLDIPEYTDPEHNQMVPHTIVCEPELIIYKIYNGYWFFGRPHRRGASPGSPGATHEAPLGLGPFRSASQSGLGTRRTTPVLRPGIWLVTPYDSCDGVSWDRVIAGSTGRRSIPQRLQVSTGFVGIIRRARETTRGD